MCEEKIVGVPYEELLVCLVLCVELKMFLNQVSMYSPTSKLGWLTLVWEVSGSLGGDTRGKQCLRRERRSDI